MSKASRRVRLFFSILGALLVGASSALAQTFDRLDRCDDMAALVAIAKNGAPRCGSSRTALGAAIVRRSQAPSYCFFTPSTPALAGFECMTNSIVKGSVDCFRPLGNDAVARIKSAI